VERKIFSYIILTPQLYHGILKGGAQKYPTLPPHRCIAVTSHRRILEQQHSSALTA